MIDKLKIKEYIDVESKLKSRNELLVALGTEFNEKNKDLIREIGVLNQQLDLKKEDLKVQGLNEYKETGEKKLTAGLGVRISKVLDYDDHDALLWAKENMSVAIKTVLDAKMFKAYAKENKLDFVKISEKATVTWPSELKLE